jgi:hypothetical protein
MGSGHKCRRFYAKHIDIQDRASRLMYNVYNINDRGTETRIVIAISLNTNFFFRDFRFNTLRYVTLFLADRVVMACPLHNHVVCPTT